ncbi:hypothetical protein [Pseudonocardia sp. NPDC049635]|uniref:hypothetical protein n=1 Tax=Pseudonocardia sp. NPDC049635 TaxID=3155506 RepID=UPI0033FF7FF2
MWLLKLSTAAAAAAPVAGPGRDRPSLSPVADLRGAWTSRYGYPSTSRGEDFESVHVVDVDNRDGRLVATSRQDGSGGTLTLSLGTEGALVTGTWRERTSPTGHYRAATYHGVAQFVLDPTGTTLTGRWLGISKRHTIKTGPWELTRLVQPAPGPDTIATTVSPSNSPAPVSTDSPSSAFPT